MQTAEAVDNLISGSQLVFANANSLFEEARILTDAKAYSRAFFLHQISIEECSKVEMLGAATAELMVGGKLHLKALEKIFRSHEAKNRNNAYYLRSSKAEITARKSGDIKAAINAFKKIQDKFHERSNLEKNSSLYVNFSATRFSAPAIRTRDLVRIRKLNEKYLSIAYDNIGLHPVSLTPA